MQITLYNNSSPHHYVHKQLAALSFYDTAVNNCTIPVSDTTSALKMHLRLARAGLGYDQDRWWSVNYVRTITQSQPTATPTTQYWFVEKKEYGGGSFVDLYLRIDPLMTYKSKFIDTELHLIRTTAVGVVPSGQRGIRDDHFPMSPDRKIMKSIWHGATYDAMRSKGWRGFLSSGAETENPGYNYILTNVRG